MRYKTASLKRYLDDLAARKPAPGGGSAAALVAATGMALLSMVAQFTIGKEKYKRHEPEMKRSLGKSQKIMKKLLELVDEDVITYTKVAQTRKKSHALYQRSLREATKVPLAIARFSFEGLQMCPALEEKGNRYLVSDVHVAQKLLSAALRCAVINVDINLPYISDVTFISQIKKQVLPWRK